MEFKYEIKNRQVGYPSILDGHLAYFVLIGFCPWLHIVDNRLTIDIRRVVSTQVGKKKAGKQILAFIFA